MVFITLINTSFEIYTNISVWLITTGVKYTLYGTYYLIKSINPSKTKEELELIELRNEISQLNKQLHLINNIHNNPNIVSKYNLNIEEPPNLTLDDEFTFINKETHL